MKIIGITIETTCVNSNCGKSFRATTGEVKTAQHSCDCNFPCNCKNNPFTYIEAECPHCGKTQREIISEINN